MFSKTTKKMTDAYEAGRQWFLQGRPAQCRLRDNDCRVRWYDGYYQTRINQRLGAIFKKYGLPMMGEE